MDAKMVTTALEIPGHDIVNNVGVVRGIVVRSRSILGSFAAGLQTIIGGNITLYTEMCEQARKDAFKLMVVQAQSHRANAIVGIRYDASEVASKSAATEVLCYGTAVVVQKT